MVDSETERQRGRQRDRESGAVHSIPISLGRRAFVLCVVVFSPTSAVSPDTRTDWQARLAANSVTLGDMHMPAHIVVFIRDVNNGFRTLSLKNDGLRKRYDGVKYDLKRAEGVVYDVSIRGLTPATH